VFLEILMKPKLWVALYDVHYPVHDADTIDCVLDFLKHNKVDGFILGGDQMDNAEISHHNKDRAKFKPKGAFKNNEKYFDHDVLKRIEKAVPRDARKIWIEGNHDFWEKQMDEVSPELEGCFHRRINLNLDARGWEFIDNGRAFTLGKIKVIHGDQLFGSFGGGVMPSRKAVDTYISNVLMGHTHSPQSYAKVSPVEDKKLMAWVAPCACRMNPDYVRNRPTAWVNGFIIIEMLPSGDFNLYPVLVTRGRCLYGGKIYGKKS
jgi:predicted phosphodiesterase